MSLDEALEGPPPRRIPLRVQNQLIAFLILTILGVAYTGARYARLDRVFFDDSYNVTAHFAMSGGVFVGSEVSYRGVKVGQVTDMKLTKSGVDVLLRIDGGWDKVPAQTVAIAANKSAVGEQYVELEPKVDGAPFLRAGSEIQTADTATPISTTELIQNADNLVQSVPQDSLKTTINELGNGFAGTGASLSRIIDTQADFLKAANDNFATTVALIADSRVVLQTQIDKADAIKGFSHDLQLFTDVLAGHDAALRQVIDSGAATSVELRTFLEQNQVDLGRLISNVLTTGKAARANVAGIGQVLTVYPTVVATGFTVLARQTDGNYNARFGLVLQQSPPACTQGYTTPPRPPSDLSPAPLHTDSQCTEPITQSDARGAQWAPRVAADYRAPVAYYDSGKLTWAEPGADSYSDLPAPVSDSDGLAALLADPIAS